MKNVKRYNKNQPKSFKLGIKKLFFYLQKMSKIYPKPNLKRKFFDGFVK
jgi:hypothetical protein